MIPPHGLEVTFDLTSVASPVSKPRDWSDRPHRLLYGSRKPSARPLYNGPYPAQTDDVVAAVKFVCDHAAEYGLDASRMAIMGESAGGFLTEFAATTLGTDYLRACVAFYSPSDLATLSEQNDVEHGGKDVNFMDILSAAMPGVLPEGEKMEEMLLQERIGTEAFREKAKAVSPAYRVSDRTPPTLLLHGTGDKAPAAVLTLRLAAQATGDYSRAELNKYGRLTWTDAAQAQIDAAKNA